MKKRKKAVKNNKVIPKTASTIENITENELEMLGLKKKDMSISIVLRYYDYTYQCFSDWKSNELKLFSKFVDKLRKLTWSQVHSQSSNKNKTGLALTYINRNQLPQKDILKEISPEIRIFELRISDKVRVHGFRIKNSFFLIWLDRNHEICPT